MSTRIFHLYDVYKVKIKNEHDHHNVELSIQKIGPPNPYIQPYREVMVHFNMETQLWGTHDCYASYATLDDLAKNYIEINPTLADISHVHGGMGMGGH